MKRTTILCLSVALCGLAASIPAIAGPKPLTELTGSATYSRPDGGHSSWAAGGELAIPLGQGYVLVGPAIQFVDAEEDFQAIGGVIEFNLMKGSGLFVGGRGLYDPDAPEGADSHTVDARAGFKATFNKGGLLKLYLQRTVDGYGKSEDLAGVAAFGVRF
jgi:hypothetical protein